MEKLLYSGLIPKAPFSQRLSEFRQAIFTIWSELTFPTCLNGFLLLINNRCSLSNSNNINPSNVEGIIRFYFRSILIQRHFMPLQDQVPERITICVSSLKCVITMRCIYVWTYVLKTSLPRQFIFNIILKEFWIVLYKIVRSYKCLNGSFV